VENPLLTTLLNRLNIGQRSTLMRRVQIRRGTSLVFVRKSGYFLFLFVLIHPHLCARTEFGEAALDLTIPLAYTFLETIFSHKTFHCFSSSFKNVLPPFRGLFTRVRFMFYLQANCRCDFMSALWKLQRTRNCTRIRIAICMQIAHKKLLVYTAPKRPSRDPMVLHLATLA
jgi:hypothetical protein